MTSSQITLASMLPEHLDGAVALSKQAGWPHRHEDWALVLELSHGIVALENDQVVGTALATPFGDDVATINMVIVDEAMRGRGLGRQLMKAALDAVEGRTCLLVATEDGLPLYEKLGFAATAMIAQHQGIAGRVTVPDGVQAAKDSDFPAMQLLDQQANGLDRRPLFAHLQACASFVVIRTETGVDGFAAVRKFGRGLVIGPVVARNDGQARLLINYFLSQHAGAFVRIDTDKAMQLGDWLDQIGLAHVGGGIQMRRPGKVAHAMRQADPSSHQTFALVNQALG